jgi:hypothetical protein
MIPHLQSIFDRLSSGRLCVLVNEEYGFRTWFWFPNLKNNDELVAWWTQLEKVTAYYEDPKVMGGYFILADNEVISKLWEHLNFVRAENPLPYIHLHWEDDSYLMIEDVTYYHKGYYEYV